MFFEQKSLWKSNVEILSVPTIARPNLFPPKISSQISSEAIILMLSEQKSLWKSYVEITAYPYKNSTQPISS